MTTRAKQFEPLVTGVMYQGSAITNGYVTFNAAGTTSAKNAWSDKEKAVAITKLALDANSQGIAYGDGNYKLRFYSGDPDDGGTELTSLEIDNYKCVATYGNTATKTANYTVTPDDDLILVNTSGGNITISIEDVDTFVNPVTIKKIHADNTVTIDPYSTQTIDGNPTIALSANNEAADLFPDTNASTWRRHADIVADGITATAAEINTACDGIVATASEINTACDGITATAAEINTACDGITATAAEINTACDGITATASEINTICDGNTATATEITAAADGIGVTIPRMKIIEIGDWNMDSTLNVSIAHGLTLAKIVGVRAIVRNDNGTEHCQLTGYADTINADGYIDAIGATSIVLERTTSGYFDAATHNSTSYNRGWIIVDYID